MNTKNKLKTERERIGLTQTEIAKTVGISIRAYKMYESGERIPRVDVAKRIAKILKSKVDKLF